jgi:hypothetical protein
MPPPLTLRFLALVALVAITWLGGARADVRPEHAALPEREWVEIQSVVSAQLDALKRGDGKTAFAFATTPLQLQFADADTFLRMVRGSYAALLTARRTEFLEGAVIDGAILQPLRLVLPDETVLVALYRMEKGDTGKWQISGCVISASTVRST